MKAQPVKLKVACIQMNSGRDIAANVAKLRTLVGEAVGKGAELVATPENTFVMGEATDGPRTLYTQENHPGIVAAVEIAKHYRCWLLIGSVAVVPSSRGAQRRGDPEEVGLLRSARNDDKTYNRSFLINPQGEITATYDKIHLFDVALSNGETYAESSRMLPGHQAVVASLSPSPLAGEGGVGGMPANKVKLSNLPPSLTLPRKGGGNIRMGMTICYDVRFPHLYRALAKAGAQILAVPSAFTVPTGEAHWHVLLRARAIENGCFVIAPAQTGAHPGGRKTYGHALIIDPWGVVLADGGTQEGIVMADLDLSQVEHIRGRLPSLEHDREFVI